MQNPDKSFHTSYQPSFKPVIKPQFLNSISPSLYKNPIPKLSLSLAKSMAASTSSATTCKTHLHLITPQLSKPYSSRLPFKFHKFTSRATAASSISCTLTRDSAALRMDSRNENGSLAELPRPDSFGRFGKYGGKYVPETLMHALTELETAFHALAHDDDFQVLAKWSSLPILVLIFPFSRKEI